MTTLFLNSPNVPEMIRFPYPQAMECSGFRGQRDVVADHRRNDSRENDEGHQGHVEFFAAGRLGVGYQ